MALKVRDLLHLQSLQGLKLVSGGKGLERSVCAAGIADYEFAPEVAYQNDAAFEKESFIISSLLFAQGDSGRILDAVKRLYNMGTSALAYKDIIFSQLPKEVLAFSNEKNYPIFAFGPELYFENIIYEIMEAVQQEDTQILAEQNIKKMIENELSREEVGKITKGISLFFKQNAMTIYVRSKEGVAQLDMTKIFRNFYLNKSLKNKGILCRYRDGFFIILTSIYEGPDKFEVILNEALEALSIDKDITYLSRSNVYHSYDQLDRCLRESYHTHVASITEEKNYGHYNDIGAFKYLVPLRDNIVLKQFSDELLKPLMDKEEFFHTVLLFVGNNGDITSTAFACSCHQNTIRYRLTKIKEIIGAGEKTEFEFYEELSLAIRIYRLKKQAVI